MLSALVPGTVHLREGAHRLGMAASIHGVLMAEGMVAGGCINIASRHNSAWLRFTTWHPIRFGIMVLDV
jgi:hypothetical protein